jgi:hypothetical protein
MGSARVPTDDNGQPFVKVDRKRKCACSKEDQQHKMVNYSMMWHDADIICARCNGFIRDWDAG